MNHNLIVRLRDTWPRDSEYSENAHEAADEIERLRGILEEIATFTSDPVAEHAAREALSLPQAHRSVEK